MRIAKEKLEQADLILAVFDSRQPLTEEDWALLEQVKSRPVIVILNKSDAGTAQITPEQLPDFPYCITMSAKAGSGLNELEAAVKGLFDRGDVTPELGILANARQKQQKKRTNKFAERFKNSSRRQLRSSWLSSAEEGDSPQCGEMSRRDKRAGLPLDRGTSCPP